MKFTKMHGAGNDYIYVNAFEERVPDPPSLARVVSDRHRGIGGDGLILIERSKVADVRMVMFNADGSRGETCGNGLRCVVKYAIDHGLVTGPNVKVETDCGVRLARVRSRDGRVSHVRVEMGTPSLSAESIPTTMPVDEVVDHPLRVGAATYRVTCVSMGNPHAVVFVSRLGTIELDTVGPLFEYAPEFPKRINSHFVQVDSPTHVTVKTWERGSGATRACGSGACAVCVACVRTGRTKRVIVASLPGGDLEVEWAEDERVYLTGPAVEVFQGEWPDENAE